MLLPPCQRVGGSGALHFAVVYLKNLFHDLYFFLSLIRYLTEQEIGTSNNPKPAGSRGLGFRYVHNEQSPAVETVGQWEGLVFPETVPEGTVKVSVFISIYLFCFLLFIYYIWTHCTVRHCPAASPAKR